MADANTRGNDDEVSAIQVISSLSPETRHLTRAKRLSYPNDNISIVIEMMETQTQHISYLGNTSHPPVSNTSTATTTQIANATSSFEGGCSLGARGNSGFQLRKR